MSVVVREWVRLGHTHPSLCTASGVVQNLLLLGQKGDEHGLAQGSSTVSFIKGEMPRDCN